MPKYRQLHLKIIENHEFNQMPNDSVRLFWVMLPLILDREGRGFASWRWIQSKMFPLREDIGQEDIITAFKWLEDHGMVSTYEVEGTLYFFVPNFKKYQSGTEKEAPSHIPAPTGEWLVTHELVQTYSGVTPELVKSTCIEFDIESESESVIASELPKTDENITFAEAEAWKSWEKQKIIAINRGKPDLVELYQPPPYSDWKTIDNKTSLLQFQLRKVPK